LQCGNATINELYTNEMFTRKRMLQKRREFNAKTRVAFVDYEKAFD